MMDGLDRTEAFLADMKFDRVRLELMEKRLAEIDRTAAALDMGMPRGSSQLLDELRLEVVARMEEIRVRHDRLEIWCRGDLDTTIVWLHHVEGWPWERVGLEVGYTGRSCRAHEDRGLELIAERFLGGPVEP